MWTLTLLLQKLFIKIKPFFTKYIRFNFYFIKWYDKKNIYSILSSNYFKLALLSLSVKFKFKKNVWLSFKLIFKSNLSIPMPTGESEEKYYGRFIKTNYSCSPISAMNDTRRLAMWDSSVVRLRCLGYQISAAALSGVVGSELLDGGYQAVRLGTVRCDTAGLLDVALLDVTLLSEASLQGC